MKKIFTLFICFIFIHTKAQLAKTADVVGSFKVSNFEIVAENLTKDQIKMFQLIEKDFYSSIFHIKPDGSFNLKSAEETSDKFKELFFLQNKCWLYDENTEILGIGTTENKYSEMYIHVMINKEKVIYHIMESPIYIELSKL